MFQQDYILRQIELLAKGIAKMLHLPSGMNVLDDVITDDSVISQEGYLRYMVMSLLDEGKPGEAEDMLFDAIEKERHREYMKIALEFYGALAEKSEKELKSMDFSHEEVLDGLAEVQSVYQNGNGEKTAGNTNEKQ